MTPTTLKETQIIVSLSSLPIITFCSLNSQHALLKIHQTSVFNPNFEAVSYPYNNSMRKKPASPADIILHQINILNENTASCSRNCVKGNV